MSFFGTWWLYDYRPSLFVAWVLGQNVVLILVPRFWRVVLRPAAAGVRDAVPSSAGARKELGCRASIQSA